MNNLNKTQKRIIIVTLILVIGIIGYYIYGRENNNIDIKEDEEILVKTEEKIKENNNGKIVIHITGAVKNEGIVTLEENSRVADAVAQAGGLTEDADMSKINLAYILEDGMKITIPSKNDIEEDTESEEFVENTIENTDKSESSKLVNINKATQTELETLPGIGPSIALKIISYRQENGKFLNIEDLKKVSGIGENKYENIKNYICVK